MAGCTHVQDVVVEPRPLTADGCQECLNSGSRWVNLRLCLHCGHVGCCDSSPNRHATAHFRATDHPVVRSFEPEQPAQPEPFWRWCFVDEVLA